MSKIAKNSIKFSKEINCSFENGVLLAKGKLGELSLNLNPLYTLDIREEELFVIPKNKKDKKNPNWGTTRALVANTIKGVSEGFAKTLELNGTGYRASVSGSKLKLQLVLSNVESKCAKKVVYKMDFFRNKLNAISHNDITSKKLIPSSNWQFLIFF